MKTDILMNGFMVKNHISLKTEFGLSVTRRTSFQSWFLACQVLPRHLHHPFGHLWNRRVILLLHLLHPHLLHLQWAKCRFEKRKMHLTVTSLQCQCLSWLMIERRNLWKPKPTKYLNLKKRPRSNGETCMTILRFRNGCKNSEKIWWMIEFLNMKTLTPVLLMDHLRSPRLRDVRIWVNTVFLLVSPKTEIARSVKGPKLQGPHAEGVMAEPYLVQKILVT